MEGKHPEDIAREVSLAYARGTLPRRDVVAFGYMWSAGQRLGPAGSWRPHMMVYAPYYKNPMLGGNEHGGTTPFVADDEGTPFTVVVVPVAPELAIRPKATASP